ncbi:hypothetical protein BDP81DRAFT_455844 [Colletotrichum phormii]|uniref:Uncharacterized protein n=1 Tax=Colletotrichum phormii TaxID=359342 RepID=A0AAI9ZCB1_9PEZI|nr:uncharacterized protein BDP81DRAFT_455844 [Colletotrichum phormii]KAK1621890.1 hypothetical protein BDP81DRAFT_455844 [Colletotrichum phormii]
MELGVYSQPHDGEGGRRTEFLPFIVGEEMKQLRHSIAASYGLDNGSIEDIYPCMPMQVSIFTLGSQNSAGYIVHSVLDINPEASVERFRAAWEDIHRSTAILRTRIVHDEQHGFLQVVLREEITWTEVQDADEYLQSDGSSCMEFGQPLSRYSWVRGKAGKKHQFIWTVHHAVMDGWFSAILTRRVQQLYHGLPSSQLVQFKAFIQHLQQKNFNEAEHYWRRSLKQCDCVDFPGPPRSKAEPKGFVRKMYVSRQVIWQGRRFKRSALVYAAWGLVMSSTTGSKSVVFGTVTSGRRTDMENVKLVAGPTICTVPAYIEVDREQLASKFVDDIGRETSLRERFDFIGLANIAKVSARAQKACQFGTLIIVQGTSGPLSMDNSIGDWTRMPHAAPVTSDSLSLDVFISEEDTKVVANFNTQVIDVGTVDLLIAQLLHVMEQLGESTDGRTLRDISLVTPEDRERLWGWNALAHHLVNIGVGPGAIVPIYFEKSMWVSVSILAVLKTGGAFLILNPAYPEPRLYAIVEQADATIVLTSVSTNSLGSRLVEQAVVVGNRLIPDTCRIIALPDVDPSSLIYTVFTSGSTGLPKGVLVSHTAFASNAHYQADELGFKPLSRVYDFANYIFDDFVYYTVITLVKGGCICVPSDDDRTNNFMGSIIATRATILYITTSVSRLLDPTHLPLLETVIGGGEPVTLFDTERWWGYANLINAYGLAECITNTIINPHPETKEAATSIGKGAGVVTWVVDPADYNSLMPIGNIGELLLEGPLLGLGYLKDPEKTVAAFIRDPMWLVKGTPYQATLLPILSDVEDRLAEHLPNYMIPAVIFTLPRLLLTVTGKTDRKQLRKIVAGFSIQDLADQLDQTYSRGPCGVSATEIEDVYPCTPLQEGLFALTSKQPGDYTLQAVLELSDDVNVNRFCASWEKAVESFAILRTRIVQHTDLGLFQVIVRVPVDWVRADDLERYLEVDRSMPMELGQPLSRYAMI